MTMELEITPSLVDGFICWGADGFVTSDNVGLYNVPTMTMGGDLDGMAKLTDMAIQFR